MTVSQFARTRLFLAVLACYVAAPAAAQDAAPRRVGAWLVSASSDQQGCFVSRTYPAPRATTLQFGLDVDGTNRLTLLNPHWSIRAKDRLRLDFRLAKAAFPRHLAIGIAADGQQGFVTTFGTTFPDHLAASPFLHVRRGSVAVEELALDGSGAAIKALRACVARHRSPPAARARARPDRIPLDPFAARRDSRQ